MSDIKDKNCYCELSEYIDDTYICRHTGQECVYKSYPNRYECLKYRRYIGEMNKYLSERKKTNA